MLWSNLLIPTQKDAPSDSPSAGHSRLARAGYIRQAGSGLYDLLPLTVRMLNRFEAAGRRALESLGAGEIAVPSLQPAELWRLAGRLTETIDARDATGRNARLPADGAPAVLALAAAFVRSHKQLPLSLARIGESFPDEPKPGGGLLRTRSVHALEAFTLYASGAADAAIAGLRDAARRVFADFGLPVVEAEDVGGTAFILPVATGGDAILQAADGSATTRAVARTGHRTWGWGGDPLGEWEKVHTPGTTTVDDVATLLKVAPRQVLKTLVYRSTATAPTLESGVNARWVIAVVRGDHEVNEAKLAAAAQEHFQVGLQPLATTPEIAQQFAVGFVGPDVAMKKVNAVLIVDFDAANNDDWVVGGNEVDHHFRHFHWFRECGDRLADLKKTAVADIRNARDGDPAPAGGTLKQVPGIVVGRVRDEGAASAAALSAVYTYAAGGDRPIGLATATIRFETLLAAMAEHCADDRGLAWPPQVSPFDCIITPIKYEGEARQVADRLADELRSAGFSVLVDDRDIRPGGKFADADLIGVTVRVTLGEKSLREGKVEIKRRTADSSEAVAIAEASAVVQAMIRGGVASQRRQ